MDDLAGLNYTDNQKAKMHQVHQDIRSRMDAVVKDDKLSREQKKAMLEGYQRMEVRQVFKMLTPEQQTEVTKKVLARRAAARKEKEEKENEREKHSPPK